MEHARQSDLPYKYSSVHLGLTGQYKIIPRNDTMKRLTLHSVFLSLACQDTHTCRHTLLLSSQLADRLTENVSLCKIDIQSRTKWIMDIQDARHPTSAAVLLHVRLRVADSNLGRPVVRHYIRYGSRCLSIDILRLMYGRTGMDMEKSAWSRHVVLSAAAWDLLDEYVERVPEAHEIRSCLLCR